ncbi:RNA polymerase sigma-70 factor, ECF subfamily [Cribrihabitans marinus]|uniref:RNA polymerase sigma factor n=2 Tax=Cribrihabitans marinus TaxID=1227549 RepID=A0A1H6TGN1_9RHOB|nr:RNA polymerase sigma factor [Cribrihabitans marinus]SEI78446.1 RNA polymerase sigma-70 factor, ECF subfamily [Cribrihabitans marinus]
MLARTAMGDRAAFGDLYAATSAKLFGVCLRVLRDRDRAEEVLQDVYVRIWNRADRYRVNGLSPMTWLITVARNLAIDRLRSDRAAARRIEPDAPVGDTETLADPGPGPEAQAMAADERAAVLECLGQLEPDREQAVRRAYLLGDSYAELASAFDVPLNTMRTWLRRSLMKLRECLAQ